MGLGLWSRLLYGGIVEEVLFRWGVLTLLVWIGAALFGDATPVVIWSAIVISGVLFGLGHLLSYMLYHLVWLPFDLHFARQAAFSSTVNRA